MDTECGLGHIPIGTEIVYRDDLSVTENGKVRRPLVAHRATVAMLYQVGAIDNEGREDLLKLKAVIGERIEKATSEQAKVPFAVSQRVIQIFVNRWTLVSKSLDRIANPYNPHGSKVYNATTAMEDRKRKANLASLIMSSLSTVEDDVTMTQQPPAANNNQDRQNPEGSGGNPI
jgi:hypothetical protein